MDIELKPLAPLVAPPPQPDRWRNVGVRLLFYVIIGTFVDALLWAAGAPLRGLAPLAPIFGAAIINLAGEAFLALFGMRSLSAQLAAAFVAGSALSSIAVMVPTLLWGWPADMAFLLWSAIVVVAVGLLNRRLAATAHARDAAAAVLFSLFVGFFARHQITALPALLHTNVLQAWTDYFIHGTTIASFGDPFAARSGDIMLPGAPRVFYHYGPFMLPAALSQISGLCGLGLATAVLLPLGLLIGLLGLYSLAREWAAFWPAFLAVGFVASLPDASTYFFKNGFFGFQWLIFTAPGSAYAIGLAAVAYACLILWFRDRRFGALMLAALLTLMLILVRVHMFLLAAPAFAGTVMIAIVAPRWRVPLVVAATLTITALTLMFAQGIAFADYAAQLAKPFTYIFQVLSFGAAPYAKAIHVIADKWGYAAAALPAALFLLFATLGLWALVFSLLFSRLAWKGKLTAADGVPPLLCCAYVLLIFWAPVAQNGFLDEYKHRHFVLLYAIIVLWTILRVVQLMQESCWSAKMTATRAGAFSAAALAVMLVAERNIDPAQPLASLSWASAFYDVQVEPGVSKAAAFIRDHAHSADDVIAVDTAAAHSFLLGSANELSSMTDMPIYIGRADLEVLRGPRIARIVKARLANVKAVEASPNIANAFAILRAHAIHWYVAKAPALPIWDKNGNAAIYHSGSIYVYETSHP